MKTPTHLCLGWLLCQTAGNLPTPHKRLVMLGSIAPDIPITIVFLKLRFITSENVPLRLQMDQYYFCNDAFIALHHSLHSPLSVLLILFISIQFQIHGFQSMRPVTCFALGASTHAVIDTFTHAADGIMVFWPVQRRFRFNAGISQWDVESGAINLLVVESVIIALTLLLWLHKRTTQAPVKKQEPSTRSGVP